MKKTLKKIQKGTNGISQKISALTSMQPSRMISFIGILLWIGASVNIAMSFVYILKETNLGAFVSMTMLASLFYLVFTSLASNFELFSNRQKSEKEWLKIPE